MKKYYSFFLITFLFASTSILSAQAICNANGNVIIYSNYDGGALTIDVDQNIPNPANGIFLVTLPGGITAGEIKIYNTLGEEIRAMQASSSTTISHECEAPGIYFIRLLTEKGMFSQRLVISK